MAPPLLTIANAGINLGDRWLFRGVDLALHDGDRLALVGRNGAGKSSLMKVLAGQNEMDEGTLWTAPGATITYLPQAPSIPAGITLQVVVTADADNVQRNKIAHEADAILMRMGLDPTRMSDGLSGGEARRVSLARALYMQPDILLLDEPTNHMDLPTIEWMEEMLRQHKGALLVVSHDRAFLQNLGTGIVWLHGGKLRQRDGHFDEFESWSDAILADESVTLHKLDRQIAAETKWSREGISARRKRNQGRLRDLDRLRSERAKAGGITQRRMRMETGQADGGGQLVLEAIDLSATVLDGETERSLLRHFNLLIRRGDRIGVVGPNGAGKTTLVRLLLELTPADSGRIKQGFGLCPAYFDQRREALDRDASPWKILTAGAGDTVEVAGQTKHVTSYLRDFMFDDEKMTQRVSTLSGGEQNRLLLAKLFAQTHNFLVLDEPTNDLDLETLELLQEVIANYDGTVLIVSHDRDFLDRTVTAVLAFEGDGKIVAHAGGYSDYLARKKKSTTRQRNSARDNKPVKKSNRSDKPKPNRTPRLSFKDRHILDTMPALISGLETQINTIETELAVTNLFSTEPAKFNNLADQLTALKAEKARKEDAWLNAAEKAEAITQAEIP